MTSYSVCDLRKGIFEDEVVITAASPMAAARKYLQPTGGLAVKRSDNGFLVITGPRWRKYVYGLVRVA